MNISFQEQEDKEPLSNWAMFFISVVFIFLLVGTMYLALLSGID